MNNSVVMAGTSRPLKPEEAQAGIQVVAIAHDAVGVIVGVNNPFKGSLTLKQLQQIYQHETTGIIRTLGNNGISYTTVSQLVNQRLVRIVPVNGINPTDKATIKDGKYPINRNVYLAVRKQNSPAVKQFIDLALSPQGQQIVEQSGFIPLQ